MRPASIRVMLAKAGACYRVAPPGDKGVATASRLLGENDPATVGGRTSARVVVASMATPTISRPCLMEKEITPPGRKRKS